MKQLQILIHGSAEHGRRETPAPTFYRCLTRDNCQNNVPGSPLSSKTWPLRKWVGRSIEGALSTSDQKQQSKSAIEAGAGQRCLLVSRHAIMVEGLAHILADTGEGECSYRR